MKKTKMIVALALAAVLVVSVGSIGFAAAGDSTTIPNSGMGSEPGTASSLVTVEVATVAPVNVSATVPITIPVVVKGGTGATAPRTYAPTTGVNIINTTSGGEDSWTDAEKDQAYAIKVDKMVARIAHPSTTAWGLKDSVTDDTGDKNNLQLTMGGATFGTLAGTSSGTASIEGSTLEAGLQKIERDGIAPISVTAQAGGKETDYPAAVGKADAFKIEIVISQFDNAVITPSVP
ncbi:hypothetical protein [Christensenella timonensis]|uniref:hypothetical protein n=1 Tax=Christensenella timonensis TaxID=1816678 RepID=UPI0008340E66|nr:hypothetical protein [Christensenella timonensis]